MAETLEAPEPASSNAAGRSATWEDVQRDPLLHDLPFKVETNQHGQVVMSPPAAPIHGGRQFDVGRLLREHVREEGKIITECPVKTSKGTKAPDVVWFSAERWKRAADESQSPIAPEICVEILSPSNTAEEMDEKRALYFEAGAEEVWLCSTEGAMRFFGPDGEQDASQRAPDFPEQIDV